MNLEDLKKKYEEDLEKTKIVFYKLQGAIESIDIQIKESKEKSKK
jgi:hypothetical protein|tara:strand:- start:474 stop:608 length:135 start_codon:yes stop_codon:yes gene_type:complete